MLNKKVLIKALLVFCFIVPMATVSVAQINHDVKGLLDDIPEPPGAKTELPSPIPMVYQFMGALMDGEYDICLSNFDVRTFLKLLYGKAILRLEKDEQKELFSYQIQTHRNEFRFLSKIMNRVAAGAKIEYSNPRYHGKVQAKVVVRLDTNRGRFDFQVFCCYSKGRWFVYDYILNNQRLTQTFRDGIQGISVSKYLDSLKPFYGSQKGTRPLRSKEFEFSMLVPNDYELHENVSPTLLATLSALNGQFLLHVQAATYDSPQTLAQVGKAIKETLMPFNPRLYDQWKGDIAGVEVGNILFHFTQGNRLLYCHMVLIPLGKKLVAFNFYHSNLQIMKHMSNIRETMIRSLSLPRIEAAGGIMPGEIPDEITLNGNEFGDGSSLDSEPPAFDENAFSNDTTFDDENSFSESDNTPSTTDDSEVTDDTNIPTSFDDEEDDNLDWDSTPTVDNGDTSSGEDDIDMLRPDSFVDDSEEESEESGSSNDETASDAPDYSKADQVVGGGYGDGNFGDDDDYAFDDGDEVEF